MKKQEAGQSSLAVRQNADFFAENDWYKSNQDKLEMYRLIAKSVGQEVKMSNRVLDTEASSTSRSLTFLTSKRLTFSLTNLSLRATRKYIGER